MKYLALGLVLAMAFSGVVSAQPYGDYGPPPTRPGVSVGLSVFYNDLAAYGQWVTLSPWGDVWMPSSVPANWRPYTDGHWVYTDNGWTWVSDFAWGWAPFHYGRWDFDASYGWCWIPGDVWGPAWVAWRWGDGYVGWAPLPPGVGWELGIGFTVANFDFLIPSQNWIFCGDRDFDRARLHGFLFPYRDNARFIRRTRDVTDFARINNRIVNRSIRQGWIARATGHAVPRFQLLERGRPGRALESRRGHEVHIYRPRFAARGVRRPMERRGFQRGRVGRQGRAFREMRNFNRFVNGLFGQRPGEHRRFQHRQSQHQQFKHQQLQRRQFQQRQFQHRQFQHRQFQRRQFQHQQSRQRQTPGGQRFASRQRGSGQRFAGGSRRAADGGPRRR